jgi:S-adenosylmethionine hydrolase
MPRVITLTTDFGLRDPFVGIMKGVILSICPTVRLVDLTHEVGPMDRYEQGRDGEPAAIVGSTGRIEIFVKGGSARAKLGLQRYLVECPDEGS